LNPVQTAVEDARFAFGENWADFLSVLDEDRITAAQDAIAQLLGSTRLEGLSFLDVGSGSGLSSLAAMRMGAERVHSFDFDAQSVACTRELKRRYFPDAENWTIEPGDATDPDYVLPLGTWDVVYSWGVLHHTGRMWAAVDLAAGAVADGGRLFIAIYNDQGWQSAAWRKVKHAYVTGGGARRQALLSVAGMWFGTRALARSVLTRGAARDRGMSLRHDLVDWVGGYPFEVARPEEVLQACRAQGFELVALETVGGRLGCNQFVFRRNSLT
jgi:2-polyprenyl-6-hydroxyphenyl methylase/3-demethylubiquinone-9 3-methyltransferase